MSEEITRLLQAAREGDRSALDRILPLVYRERHELAHRRLGADARRDVLDTTVLVHEVYLKLRTQTSLLLEDRRHFFAVAAMAMRQIVIDHARRRAAGKRGGGMERVDLDRTQVPVEDRASEILELEDALRHLETLDPRLGRVVELRFFGGLSTEETAEVLDVNARTVKRDWRKARAFLYALLAERAQPRREPPEP